MGFHPSKARLPGQFPIPVLSNPRGPLQKRGISGATLNRHLTFLSQLLTYLKAQGLPLDPSISVALLQAKTKNRARNKRAALTNEDVGAIFRLACFTVITHPLAQVGFR